MSEKQVTIGRMVYYRVPDGPSRGEYRPAVVVRVWGQESGCANLQVFTDDMNDGDDYKGGVHWATSVTHGPGEHEWLWPEELTPEQQLGK